MKRVNEKELEEAERREFHLLLTAKFFRGLGDPTRVKILEYLLERERNVTELVKLLGLPQGRVSNHLACLKWCGYVAAKREGRYTCYQVVGKSVKDLLMMVKRMVTRNTGHSWACTRTR